MNGDDRADGQLTTAAVEEIEAHYRQSPFIKEVCVFATRPPHAIVVPDLDVLRARKIVNVRELIRFELEGLSVSLPPHARVDGFDVTLSPLPRTATGGLSRDDIARQRGSGPAAPRTPSPDLPSDGHMARVVALVQTRVGAGVAVCADSNLELDLGLDSMERVELIAFLEQRFGTRVPDEISQSAFLVRELGEAFRGAPERDGRSDVQWTTMLHVAQPGPDLQALLSSRRLTALVIFAVTRVVVGALARPEVTGLEHLPRRGPFIISPNHQSYVDPFVLMGVLPLPVLRRLFFVGAAEYFQTSLTAWLARQMNVVPVDPDANLVPAMQAGAFGLRHGKVLVLFPEGERSIDGRVRKFKKGAAILSQHLDVPIVPVALDGVFDIWPRNRPLDWHRLLPWSGHRVRVRFGAPLRPEGSSCADETLRLRTAVEELWSSIALRRLHGLDGSSRETGRRQLRA